MAEIKSSRDYWRSQRMAQFMLREARQSREMWEKLWSLRLDLARDLTDYDVRMEYVRRGDAYERSLA